MAEALQEAKSLNASLDRRLSTYSDQSRRIRPDIARAYDELVGHLGTLDRGELGPQIGEPMQAFSLPDENGCLVSLTSLLQSGPAVISFNRGHWCPYCKLELRSLAAIHGQIRQLGARVVSIMPDIAQFTKGYKKQNDFPFPILSDIDLGYSLSLGLIFWVGPEIRRLYEEVGIELAKYHGNQGFFLPTVAKFVVGQDGLVKAQHVNIEFRRRMDPDALLAVLKKLPGLDV